MISTLMRVPRRINAGHLSNSNNYYNDTESTPLLHSCVKSGDIENISKLISSGIDVNVGDGLGMTPLMLAIVYEDASIMELLLKANADIHATDAKGESALSMTIEYSNGWILYRSPKGCKILDLIFERVKKDFFIDKESTVRKLRNVGCPITLVPFMGDVEVTKYFLKRADDFAEFRGHTTILHTAVVRRDIENVKVLVAYYLADINNFLNYDNQTALLAHEFNAIDSTDEEIEILKILLDNGASLNVVDKHGKTPIELFLTLGNRKTRMTVLKSNAIRECMTKGVPALHYLLVNKNENPISSRSSSRFLEEEIKTLVNMGFDINMRNKDGDSALIYTIKHQGSCLKVLIENGAKVNWPEIVSKTSILQNLTRSGSWEKWFPKFSQDIITIIFQYQFGINVKRLFREMNGRSKKIDPIFYAQIVIAQVMISVATGEKISINQACEDQPLDWRLKEHFKIYKQIIEQMKTVKVCNSVSLYELLTVSDAEMDKYVRKDNILSELQNLFSQEDYKHLYYVAFIRKRIENALETVALRKKCGRKVSELTGLDKYGFHGDHHVTNKIIGYLNLSKEDQLNLCESQATLIPNIASGLGNLVTRTIKKVF